MSLTGLAPTTTPTSLPIPTPATIDFDLAWLEAYTVAQLEDFCKLLHVSLKGFTQKVELQKALRAWAESRDGEEV